jgi:hypothetical protein
MCLSRPGRLTEGKLLLAKRRRERDARNQERQKGEKRAEREADVSSRFAAPMNGCTILPT